MDAPAALVAVEEGPGIGSCETRASDSAPKVEGASGTGGRDTCPPALGFILLLLYLYKMGESINIIGESLRTGIGSCETRASGGSPPVLGRSGLDSTPAAGSISEPSSAARMS